MEKTMKFNEHVDATVATVWEILKNPAPIVSEYNAHVEMKDNLHWVQRESAELENVVSATLDEGEHRVHISSESSKYKSEGSDIVLALEEDGSGCVVHVQYTVKTKGLFNMIALKAMGDKLEHHASNTIIKNIKKELK